MPYKYNGITKKLDRVEDVSGIQENADSISLLEGNITLSEIYVSSTTGDDDTGDGSIETPFATVGKAYGLVPRDLNTSVSIKIANGTYSSFPEIVRHDFGADGMLGFDGYEMPVNIKTGLTVTGVTPLGLDMVEVTVSAEDSTWSAEELYGQYAYFTSGAETDSYFPIHQNGSMTFTCRGGSLGGIAIGNVFNIVEPGVKIETSKPISFAANSFRNFMCQMGAFNMRFEYVGADIGVETFTLTGTTLQFHHTVQFISEIGNAALSINGSGVNPFGPKDQSVFSWDKQQWWNDLIMLKCGIQAMGNKLAPPTAHQTLVSVTTVSHGFSGTSINFISTRGNLALYATKVSVNNCAVESFQVDHGCYTSLSVLYTDREFSPYNIRVDDFSTLEMQSVYFNSAATRGFSIETGSKVSIEAAGAIDGVEPTYMFYINAGCYVELGITPAIGGVTNDVYFVRSAAGLAYPTAGNNVNDSELSYVIR
jgi:hypothetical protein